MSKVMMRSTAVVSVCTALSRILGLTRNVLMASMFGTSLVQSAFVIAFKIPNLFRRLFGEGALSAAFIPVFTEVMAREGMEKANIMAGRVMTMLAVTLSMIVLGGILVITAWLKFLPVNETTLAVLPLLRIMMPYMFFICLVALCMAILNSFNHFFLPAFTPVILNVVWIFMLIFVCPRLGDTAGERIYGVAWGILGAGAIQFCVQIPMLLKHGFNPGISFFWRDENVRKILMLMGPAAFGTGVFQINVLIDSLLALVVAQWAPAALSFAELLINLPLAVFSIALGTVLLPTFSRQVAERRPDDMKKTLNLAVRIHVFLMLPAVIGLLVLAGPIVRALYESGEFDSLSTIRTTRAVMFYAPGLIVFGMYKLIVPVFYALKDTATPVRVGVRVVALNLVMNIAFILTWPAEYKHAGLAFATVLASAVNCFVLALILQRKIGSPGWNTIARSSGRSLAAAIVMGLVLLGSIPLIEGAITAMGGEGKTMQILTVIISILLGLAVYFLLASKLCKSEMQEAFKGKSD